MEHDAQPLHGFKVIDLTQAMAGPFATMLLGDLGCDIIKIEPPGGDQTRRWAPPEIDGMSSYFMSANRNKRSITLDLKSADAIGALKQLIMGADVLIENFRPGIMERLGLSYEIVSSINDKIVYCSISGFGQTGPFRDYPGYDLTVLAYSGLLSITGENGRPPVKFGVPMADITAGLFADIAVLSALLERSRSGKGQYIDMAMYDTSIATLTHQAYSYFATGVNPSRLGSSHASIAPYQAFRTSDGYVCIGIGTEKLWSKFLGCMNLQHLSQREEFSTNSRRVENREQLEALIETETSVMTTESTVNRLKESGIPCAPITSVGDALASDQSGFRGMVLNMKSGNKELPTLGSPFKLSRTPGIVKRAAPLLGEHTLEILRESGVDEETITRIVDKVRSGAESA